MLGGRAHRDTEIGTDDGLADRARHPAAPARASTSGRCVLVRDVTDLRRRDRELVTKDATIREIHHRVKNNLQTVAALLRLQARRMDSRGRQGGARGGGTPGRLDRDRARDAEPGGRGERRLRRDRRPARRDGDRRQRAWAAGCGSAARARSACCPRRPRPPLAMVLTELLQNAVEHGYPASRTPAATDRGHRAPGRGPAARHRRRRRARAARGLRPRRRRPAWGCRSCAPWWSPSSAVSSSSARRRDGRGTRVADRRTRSD